LIGAAARTARSIDKERQDEFDHGEYDPKKRTRKPIPFDSQLRTWHRLYSITFKPRYRETSETIVEKHLIPFFGSIDIREIGNTHLLEYIRLKLDEGQKPPMILTALSVVRRVLSIAMQEGLILHNPANGVGRLIARVARSKASVVTQVDAWTRNEVGILLGVAEEHEPVFAPLLRFLLSTGARRGEALGLRWEDVDLDRHQITIRRALTKGQEVTPKSGLARKVAMPPTLTECLFDLLGKRRHEMLTEGRPDIPATVFCSRVGKPLDERNVTRSWYRVRRRAQKQGVRPLKLHTARHTYATFALDAGRSIRFVSEQLGHSNPAFTLRVYAHAMPAEHGDVEFANFSSVAKRRYASPTSYDTSETENAPGVTGRGRSLFMEHETRFELATLTLARETEPEEDQ
jgi:integrase